jgi:hypothetical protein
LLLPLPPVSLQVDLPFEVPLLLRVHPEVLPEFHRGPAVLVVLVLGRELHPPLSGQHLFEARLLFAASVLLGQAHYVSAVLDALAVTMLATA